MNEQELWDRVNELLDERSEPLADGQVQEGLRDHPNAAASLERLLSRVRQVEHLPRSQPHRRIALVAAALLCALGSYFAFALDGASQLPLDQVTSAKPQPDPSVRLVHYRMTVRDADPQGVREAVFENGRVSRTYQSANSEARTSVTRITVESSRRRLP